MSASTILKENSREDDTGDHHDKPVYQILYLSHATVDMHLDTVMNIVKNFSINNEKNNISGFLLFYDNLFLQVIEGSKVDVDDLFSSIQKDTRHRSISVLYKGFTNERDFSGWGMGFLQALYLSLDKENIFVNQRNWDRKKPSQVIKYMKLFMQSAF